MCSSRSRGCIYGGLSGHQIDIAKLRSFRRIRMRNSHQLHKCVRWRDSRSIRIAFKRAAENDIAASGKLAFRALSYEGPYLMPTRQQLFNQWPSHIARPAGDKNAMMISSHRNQVSFKD